MNSTSKLHPVRMSVVSRYMRRFVVIIAIVAMSSLFMAGCGRASYAVAYTIGDTGGPDFATYARPYADNLCVVTGDTGREYAVGAALLCDLDGNSAIYAQSAHERANPASLTKIMTALVALKYGQSDQPLVMTEETTVTEANAHLLGLKIGDTMTLSQALRVMLLYSANEVAMMVAAGVGGTVEHFVDMMNAEAKLIGATETHFMNPHGLTDAEHYTSAYDLYLILQAASRYEEFCEIVHMAEYSTVYRDSAGNEKQLTVNTTNRFLRGSAEVPATVTVVGGKTGNTTAAGSCLAMYFRDRNGSPYIGIVLGAESSEASFTVMSSLMEKAGADG